MKKNILQKIKSYLEIIILCITLLSTFWYGIVRPAIKKIVREDLTFTNFLIMEMATNEELEAALKKYQIHLKTKPQSKPNKCPGEQ